MPDENQAPERPVATPRPIELTLPRPDGDKKIQLRFPTDAEWIRRQKTRRVIQQSFGRGQSETDVLGAEESDEALVKAVIPADFELEPGEATMIAAMLGVVFITEVRRDGAPFRVTIQTVGGEQSSYTVKVPSALQAKNYRQKFSRPIDLPHGKTEFKVNIEAGGELFDALCDQKALPIIYKSAIAAAVVSELERLMEPSTEGL